MKNILKEINRAIDELEFLREIIEHDGNRVNDNGWSKSTPYARIDGSKQLITRSRLKVHRLLINLERDMDLHGFQYNNIITSYRRRLIDDMKNKTK